MLLLGHRVCVCDVCVCLYASTKMLYVYSMRHSVYNVHITKELFATKFRTHASKRQSTAIASNARTIFCPPKVWIWSTRLMVASIFVVVIVVVVVTAAASFSRQLCSPHIFASYWTRRRRRPSEGCVHFGTRPVHHRRRWPGPVGWRLMCPKGIGLCVCVCVGW